MRTKYFTTLAASALLVFLVLININNAKAQLIINEVHADPAGDITGDANGDGTRSASDDEFIEFVNIGAKPLDISGYKIFDAVSVLLERHVFPPNTIVPAGGAIVVFGGGTPTGTFGGSLVQVASTGALGITNSDEILILEDNLANPLISFTYGAEGNSDQSITRSPDVLGGDSPMALHSTGLNSGGTLFSPGTRIDGLPFGGIIINEIHADPAGDLTGDANGDGIRDASADEFIEFVNSSLVDIDISGWKLYDNNSATILRHVFPASTIVPAGGALVVFGGETPTGTFGGSIVQVASEGTGLAATNTSETFDLFDENDNLILTYTYGAEGNGDQSITRDPDVTGSDTPMVGHSVATGSGGTLFSPGTKVDGSPFIAPEATQVLLATSALSVNEGDGSVNITVSIVAPDPGNPTTVDLVLTSGSNTDIGNYTTQTITFPAGSSENQSVTISITNDANVESDEEFVFELQNIAGGNAAEISSPATFTLTIQDNDFATSSLIINEYMAWPAGGTSEDPTVDSNGDGAADFVEDEFIEFVNTGTEALDISGWTIYDEYTQLLLRHTFPPGTIINPGGALVVFGGGNPTGEFGGAQVQIASTLNLGLTNTNDGIRVKNSSDELIIQLSYGQQKRGTSTTLNPDISGAIGPHPDLEGLHVSPGTKVDGTPFAVATLTTVQFASASGSVSEDGGTYLIELSIIRPDNTNPTTAEVVITTPNYTSDMEFTTQMVTFPAGSSANQTVTLTVINDDDKEGDELFQFKIQNIDGGNSAVTGTPKTFEFVINDEDVPLFFNEILADPASGSGGDANHDGISDPSGDEFIEVINQLEIDVDLSGWGFYVNDELKHVFSDGTSLQPGRALVVFGGGIPTGTFGGSEIQLASTGSLDLPNEGAFIKILNTTDELAAAVTYGTLANNRQSITRYPDITGGLTTHSTIPAANNVTYSPGTKVDGRLFINLVTDLEENLTAVNIYPNPVHYKLTIQLDRDPSAETQFTLMDYMGREVSYIPLKTKKTEVDITTFSKGIYFYRLSNGGIPASGKSGKLIFK